MKFACFAYSLLFPLMVLGQHVLTLQVTSSPPTHREETIFVSGNFNRWKPDDPEMKMHPNKDGTYSLSIRYDHIPSDRIEFKFTRGSWQTSESSAAGRLTQPRLSVAGKDSTVFCKIEGWRDDFPASTASKNVHLVKERFYSPQLNRYRKIWIYLPEDYEHSEKKYPVLYLQDGQDLFDEATSKGRIGPIEWEVDETLDRHERPSIIVGIEHNADIEGRIRELYVHPTKKYPEVEGKDYLAFIVQTLKPYIDHHYRTLPDKAHTGIGGSSMGGLLALYGGLLYPDLFGYVAAFSPSIWLDDQHIEKEISRVKDLKAVQQQHYFFYAGDNENREKEDGSFVRMTTDVNRIITEMKKRFQPDIKLHVNPYGRHGALYWREAFPVFYDWYSLKTIPQQNTSSIKN